MKVTTTIRRTHTLETDEGEVALQYEPYYENDIMVERVGDKLVVAYLVHDAEMSESPLESSDNNGNIYQRRDRGDGLYEPGEVYSALGLSGENDPDIDQIFYLDGERTSLRGLALTKVKDETPPSELADFDEDTFDEEVETLAYSLYRQHWRAIVGPYVVPISYCGSNHGPGTMTCSPTSWDGDPDDLPDGVWVADKGAIENIEHPAGNHETTLAERAFDYAKAVCSEYQDWGNGEVYGCVVETFQQLNVPVGDDDTEPAGWEKVAGEDFDNSCWGFIGHDYAIETLKSEYFDPAVKHAAT